MDGLQAAINPEPLVNEAEPIARKFTSYVDQVLPAGAARYVPSRTTTLVRLHGAIQAAGALMMATGVFKRFGAVIVAASFLPKVLSSRPTISGDMVGFTKDLGLLGAVMLEVQHKGKTGCGCRCSRKKAARKPAKATPPTSGSAVKVKKDRGQTEALRRILSSAAS